MSDYQWPNAFIRDAYMRETKGDKERAIALHKEDIAKLAIERAHSVRMGAIGYHTAPDGSWRHATKGQGAHWKADNALTRCVCRHCK